MLDKVELTAYSKRIFSRLLTLSINSSKGKTKGRKPNVPQGDESACVTPTNSVPF
jgi:hypothetical protein